jgi:hypothetical protein
VELLALTTNSELLEILLHLNDSTHIPSYDLGRPHEDVSPVPSASAVPALEPDVPRSLSTLLNIPHTHLSSTTKLPSDVTGDHLPGYFASGYEEEYLNNFDPQIATDDALENVHLQLRLPPSRILPSEKELTNQNPMSVLSWLRRHHPETFIQEKEAASEKSAPRQRGGGGGKRSSLAHATNANPAPSVTASTPGPKTEHDTADEEPTAENAGSEKGGGRRGKQKDDEPYRPKGGSSRAQKRKREDGETPKGGRKKAKAATSTPS